MEGENRFLERLVELLELELQLVLGHQMADRRISEALLDLPHDDRVNLLGIARLASDVEYDSHWLDAGDEVLPRRAEPGRLGGAISREERFGEKLLVREDGPVEREAEQFGKA